MSKPLPEEIKFRIEQEAIKAAKKTHDFELSEWGRGSRDGYAQGHIAGAESYCTQYLAEKERADRLEKAARRLFLFIEPDGKPYDGYRFREEAIELQQLLSTQTDKTE